MAAAKKTDSPFLVRRIEVLKKLQTNKQWLEESFKKVKEAESEPETITLSKDEAEEWVTQNLDTVLDFAKDLKNIEFSNHWSQDFAKDGRFTFFCDLKKLPSFPRFEPKEEKEKLALKKLSCAVKSAFISTTTSHGKVIPSRYQSITQYIILFENSTEEFIDAKFYDDVPTLLPNFEEQYNLSSTID